LKTFQKDYQRAMYDVNRYISNMTLKDGWGKEIKVNKKDYDALVKSGHAKEIGRLTAIYRQEYTIIVR
jgi:hypothetical protein